MHPFFPNQAGFSHTVLDHYFHENGHYSFNATHDRMGITHDCASPPPPAVEQGASVHYIFAVPNEVGYTQHASVCVGGKGGGVCARYA